MSTKSSDGSRRRADAASCQRAPGSRSAHTARWAGRTSVAATIWTSSRASQPGTWPWTATLPRPMIAPRTRAPRRARPVARPSGAALVEPVLPADRAEGLVEDGQSGEGLRLGDDQGRVDAHGG